MGYVQPLEAESELFHFEIREKAYSLLKLVLNFSNRKKKKKKKRLVQKSLTTSRDKSECDKEHWSLFFSSFLFTSIKRRAMLTAGAASD